MAPPKKKPNWLFDFVKHPAVIIIAFFVQSIITGIAIYISWKGFPEQIEQLVLKIEKTHDLVTELSSNLKDDINGGRDIVVGISKEAPKGQAVLVTNGKFPYTQGQKVVLFDQGSLYQTRIVLMVAEVRLSEIEHVGNAEIFINKEAAEKLDLLPSVGVKKFKIMSFEESEKCYPKKSK